MVLFLSVFRHRPAAPAAESVRMRKGYTKPSFQSRPVFSRTKRKRILHLLLDITGRRKRTICLIPPCGAHTPYGIILRVRANCRNTMARPKKIDGDSRHGKHAPGVFRVSLYLSAEEKAIAILTAERQSKTLSDVLRSGIVCEATRSGVLVNGVVAEEFRARISAYRQVLEAEAQTKRSTEK